MAENRAAQNCKCIDMKASRLFFILLSQEPCSALMDLRRWSDRKTLRGLRWLVRAVCLDFPELCARVAQDSQRPLEPRQREKNGKTDRVRRKTKEER